MEEKLLEGMTFGDCLVRMANEGGRFRRLAWIDNNSYITIRNEQLEIFRTDTKRLHPLIVSVGDILSNDWIEVKKETLS